MKQTPEERKTKEQLAAENAELRARLEALESECQSHRAESEQAAGKAGDELQATSRTRTAELRKTLETLTAERQRFTDVLDMLPAYLVLLTPDYHVPFANKFFRERFGESGGKRCFEYLFHRTEPCEVCETYKVLKTMKPLEWEWTGPDGHNYYIYDFPFPDSDGTTLIMEVGLDITEQKKAQAALRKAHDELEVRVRERTAELSTANEQLQNEITERKKREKELVRLNRTLRAISNSDQVMMRATDESQYLKDLCKIVVEDCGHEMVWIGFAEEDEGKTVRPVASAGLEQGYLNILRITWADTERGRGPTGTAIRTGKTVICRNMLTDPNFAPWREEARKRGYASSIVLPLMADGKAFGAINIYSKETDPFSEDEVRLLSELSGDLAYGITVLRQRKAHARVEEALRVSQHDLSRAQAVAGAGNWRMDVQRNELTWSEENHRIFGVPYGKPMTYEFFLSTVHPDDKEYVDRMWQAALRGEPYDIEHRIVVDGKIKWVREKAELEFNKDGALLGGFGITQDITERKRTEEELEMAKINAEKAKEAAEAANKAKDHFLAVLSHELRTPLTPVVGMVSILQKDARFDADTRDGLDMIRRNVELEARLIDDLLDVTRIERGKIQLDQQAIDLCTVMRRAVEVCMPDIKEWNLNLAMDVPEESHWVYADPVRLQQVFWNLVKNAVKFTPPGGHISIRCRREGDANVIVEVSDTGRGIKPELMPRLFSAFEQGERPTGLQFGGLGLGLAISKALVEMHGGTLTAHSEGEGKGATFAVRLPMLPAEPAVKAPAATVPQPLSAQSRHLRILLVEDHENTARMMSLLLSSLGHEVRTAGDVGTALRLAGEGKRGNFDLLISDLGLPDGSGLDLMRSLRARGLSLPGIALSGYGTEQDVQHSMSAGFAEHLVKPVDISQVESAIARVSGGGSPPQ